MWIEVLILKEKDSPDWAAMGVKKPRNHKAETYTTRRLIWTGNIEYPDEHPEGTELKFYGIEEPLLVKNPFDEIAAKLIEAGEPDGDDLIL